MQTNSPEVTISDTEQHAINGSEPAETKLGQPGPYRLECDALAVHVGATTYYPRVGQWVDLKVHIAIREKRIQIKALAGVDAIAAMSQPTVQDIDAVYDALYQAARMLVVGWNWTDDKGEPLADPGTSPEVLEEVTEEELIWILTQFAALQGATAAELKKEPQSPPPST